MHGPTSHLSSTSEYESSTHRSTPNMSVSPSPSPRRLQRQTPSSPLATQPRNHDNSSFNSLGTAKSTVFTGARELGRSPVLPPAQPNGSISSRPPSPLRRITHGYSHSYSHSTADRSDIDRLDRDNNYGYRPTYKDDASIDSNKSTTSSRASSPLRPFQEYHNAYANTNTVPLDSPLSLPPPPSSSGSASPTSKFATISSASRAFFQHRRNQSIPNLMPTISSIGRNLGRAISPEQPLQTPTSPKRLPIPDYRDSASRKDSEDDDSESASSDGSYSEDDDSDDSEDDEPRHRRSSIMASFTGDSRPLRRSNTSTTPSINEDLLSDTASIASGYSNWPPGQKVKAQSLYCAPYHANSRTTTPEPSIFTSRGGLARSIRRMSLASNASLTPRSNILATSNSPSRFSQLATTMSATLSRLTKQSPRPAGVGFEGDELYHLNLDDALFPTGQPSERDASNPLAFKNLEVNATGALRQMQAAYRDRTAALHDMKAEKSVCDEEFEEVEIRVQHLKMQLEDMARHVADQQREMENLKDELAAEKKARAQERAMFLSGVPSTPTAASSNSGLVGSPPQERDDEQAGSVVLSEDLDVDDAQRRRSYKSNASSTDETDDGEYESGSSLFSRPRSPTIAPSITYSLDGGSVINGGDAQHQVPHPRVAALGSRQSNARSASSSSTATVISQNQPMTTFQKIVKNVTGGTKDEELDVLAAGPSSCDNCRGQDVSFAWNTVSVLRDENKHLKQRVGQLEVAVESALDMVNGVGV